MSEIVKSELKKLFYASFSENISCYELLSIYQLFKDFNKIFPNDEEIDKWCRGMAADINFFRKNEIETYLKDKKKKYELFMCENKDFFDKNVLINDYSNKSHIDKITKLSKDNISQIIKEFLLSIDNDLYLFYQKMESEGRIIIGGEAACYFSSCGDSNNINTIEKLETLEDIMILMHEIGHAYYNYINNVTMKEEDDFQNEIKSEIPANLLAARFFEFVQKNISYEEGLYLEDVFYAVAEDYNGDRDMFNSLKYVTSFYIVQATQNVDLDIVKCFTHIHESDIFTLIYEVNNKIKIDGNQSDK